MKRRLSIILNTLVVLSLLLAGCEGIATPTSVPAISAAPEGSAAPDATATPLPPQAPRVVSRVPEQGEEQALDAPLIIAFDQPMDQATAEAALAIDPEIDGTLTWDDEATLRFAPADGWARAATYQVTLGTGVASEQGLALAEPYVFAFDTVGYLGVADVFPRADSADVAGDSTIRVIFDRPVVPLTALEEQGDLPAPLTFEPAVAGSGAWTNTSIYSFQPAASLVPGTTYTATVAAGLEDSTGAVLKADYVWSFQTESPAVTLTEPQADGRYVDPRAAVRITFNQAMSPAATEERFSLLPEDGGTAVAGAFSWEENTLVFTPDEALARDERYRVQLAAGASALNGDAATAEALDYAFDVAPLPRFVSILPKDGSTDVARGDGMQITFSSPISETSFLQGFSIVPEVDVYAYWNDAGTLVNVWGYFAASTRYTVTLSSEIAGRYGDTLPATTVVRFTTQPEEPLVQLNVSGQMGSYNAYTEPVAYVIYRNVTRLNLSLYALSEDDFIRFNEIDSWSAWEDFDPAEADLVRRWSQSVSPTLNQYATYSTTLSIDDGSPLASGFYYLELTAPESSYPARHLLVVSPLNVTLKSSLGQALAWVTDLDSGQPVARAEVIAYGGSGQMMASGRTDGDGLVELDIAQEDPWAPIIVIAQAAGEVGAVTRDWSQGISPWDFDLSSEYWWSDYRAYLYTDRQIYRPGQTVHLKGILRADDDASYSLPPAGAPVDVVVTDEQGREFWHEQLPLSDLGTVAADVALSENAGLGYYGVLATLGGESFSTGFQVAEYRKPEFQVEVETERADYYQGETLIARGRASYFTGGAVANAAITWRVMREPYVYDRWEGEGYYSFSDYDDDGYGLDVTSYGEFLTEGTAQTDSSGNFFLRLPLDISDRNQSQRYTIEISVVDVNNQEVTARNAAVVHKGSYYIGLASDEYVGTAGREMAVQAITVDTQGQPVDGRTLQVVFYKHEWYSVQEEAEDGSYYWTNEVSDTPVVTRTVTTAGDEPVSVSFTPPEGGTYKVLATGRDASRREVRSALYLWVSDVEYINWGQRNTDRIDLVADKKSYVPGDTASILVPSPYEGPVQALLTIERGAVLEHRVIELESNSEQIEIPITADYAPNVFVSLVIVKGMDGADAQPGFKVGYLMLPVSTVEQELQVRVSADHEGVYGPRDVVTYTVETLDHAGQGVPAEVSLQLVDLAVETLAGGSTADILGAFYSQRGLGVNTAATLAMSVDRNNLELAAEGKGGGGGDGDGTVREDFPDTAYWNAAVRTDAQGRAQVAVTLPDSLTTWRLTAQAVTSDTLVGVATNDIVTTLDVLVRPAVPRFMVIGDRPQLSAAVHNNTAAALDLAVALEAQGLAVETPEQIVRVPAHGVATVAWVTEVEAVESARLLFSVEGGGYTDAVQLDLPVYHASATSTVGTSGEVDEETIELVRLPQGADTSLGELTVNLEPSLAAGLQEGLDYLRAYPYDCIEQTVSRFLPNAVTYRALVELGIDDAQLQEQLVAQVGIALQRIYTLQNLDGGWGWWSGNDSSPTLSAYVLLGLVEVRRADLAVDDAVMDRAAQYLIDWLNGKTVDSRAYRDERAMVLYALAEAGQGDLGRTVVMAEEDREMSLYARAYVAMALQLLDPEETEYTDALLNEFVDAAIVSGTGAHWEEAAIVGGSMNTQTRSTAVILRALARLQPDNALLPGAVRWLMNARQSGRWETTQENVWSILALTDYMVATGELEADYGYRLQVGDAELASGTVTPMTIDRPIRGQVPVAELAPMGDTAVVITRSANTAAEPEGRLYYSAFLRYYMPVEQVGAVSRGVFVQRQYFHEDDLETPVTEAAVNDLLVVKLTLIAPTDLYFLVLEDPLPAGCEALDTSLATTRTEEGPEFTAVDAAMSGLGYWYGGWPTHTELRDEKTVLFADYLGRGTYEYTYRVRCTTAGEFRVVPASAYEMYMPDVFGRSDGTTFTVAAE